MEPIQQYSNIQFLVQKEIDDKILKYASDARYNKVDIPAHNHDGVNSANVRFSDNSNKFFYLPITLNGTSAATATNYGVIFIAPFPCSITEVIECHQTAGTGAGSVTLNLEKLIGTQALDAGATMINAIDLKGTANTVIKANLLNEQYKLNLAVGDRIALKDTGTLTSLAGVSLMIKINY